MISSNQYKLEAKDEAFSFLVNYCTSGDVIGLQATPDVGYEYAWSVDGGSILELPDYQKINAKLHWDTAGTLGIKKATVTFFTPGTTVPVDTQSVAINIRQSPVVRHVDSLPVSVSMKRSSSIPTKDQAFWTAIRNRTRAIRFNGSGYNSFINRVLGQGNTAPIDLSKTPQNSEALKRQRKEFLTPVHGTGAYELLKAATQVFLLMEAGVIIEGQDRYTGDSIYDPLEEASRLGRALPLAVAQEQLNGYLENYVNVPHLPYIVNILKAVFGDQGAPDGVFDVGYLHSRATSPSMLELIFSYWMEEGLLVQTINAICLRFQNFPSRPGSDPLAHMEIAPLYPINNLLWGYIRDEHNRLGLRQKAQEYAHQYGLKLYGKAVSDLNSADKRSKFLEAFHQLLFAAATFYKRDDDTTVVADGFPLLNALKEVHLILAEGAHNQFGDLPWTARTETLIQQYLLARPEMHRFLQSREMVPYKEGWMAQVDTMKTLQGWTDVSITHFQSLAEFGEQLLLSVRYGDWIRVEDANQASNWARYWRPEIQGYIHAYRACTGVDLIADTRDSQQLALLSTQPGILLQRRLAEGNRHLPAPMERVSVNDFRSRRQPSAPKQLP
jgi:hypothetical protein